MMDIFQSLWNSCLLSILAAAIGLYVGFVVAFRKADRWRGSGLAIAWSLGIAVVTVGMGIVLLKMNIPPWIYFPLPVLVSLVAPWLIFRPGWKAYLVFLGVSTIMSPLTHFLWSFLLDYHNYLPFWKIPSLWDLLGM
jgi:ABC-type Fe3+ transport system permease subunit